jgi:hypothetical protein
VKEYVVRVNTSGEWRPLFSAGREESEFVKIYITIKIHLEVAATWNVMKQ